MILVKDIRNEFERLLNNRSFTTDKNGGKVIEILGASFRANENHIFGEPNKDYIGQEIDWYKSLSTNINDLSFPPPKAWVASASRAGEINSNYGLLIYSDKYYNQSRRVLDELINNPLSRRATMIYNRPSIWVEYNEMGKSDFICTNAVSYYIRHNELNCVVQMRSNDAWAGYRNDWAWQRFVLKEMLYDLNERWVHKYDDLLKVGNIYWQVQNLHVYDRNFYLVDHYMKTGQTHISKEDYIKEYPNSEYK
jgi:thymidylate synthase